MKILGFDALTGSAIASTTILMTRRKNGAHKRSTDAREMRGPDRAGAQLAAETREGTDVFERLAGCSSLLRANELAALLALSPKTIYSYVARNLIPHYKIAASIRFRARDIVEWLRSHAA
jgi:excisionase family DNA binding protein